MVNKVMDKSNLVSVIIPAYNCQHYVTDAINSVLSQTYNNVEIIVVDDGSVDDTSNIVKEYALRHVNIKYIYQPNKGPAAARNNGIKIATGQYIAFLDADDIWLPKFLSTQVNKIQTTTDIGFVYCNNHYVDKDKNYIKNYVRKTNGYTGDVCLKLFCEHFLLTPSVLIKKCCFDDVGLFDESLRVGEDYEFFLRLSYAYKADFVNEKLWERRVISTSLSRQDYVLDATSDLRTLKNFLGSHPELFKKNKKQISKRMSDYHFMYGYKCLEHGENIRALKQFCLSINYMFSIRCAKNILLTAVPYKIREKLKYYLTHRNI